MQVTPSCRNRMKDPVQGTQVSSASSLEIWNGEDGMWGQQRVMKDEGSQATCDYSFPLSCLCCSMSVQLLSQNKAAKKIFYPGLAATEAQTGDTYGLGNVAHGLPQVCEGIDALYPGFLRAHKSNLLSPCPDLKSPQRPLFLRINEYTANTWKKPGYEVLRSSAPFRLLINYSALNRSSVLGLPLNPETSQSRT